jgi:hypothetical protein
VRYVTCLAPWCKEKKFSRGLCSKHYRRARYFIRAKLMPEIQLVRTGKMLPVWGRSLSNYADFALPPSKIPPPPDSKPETLWFWNRA